jgi:hypothetical protein
MADAVYQALDRMLPALEDLQVRGIFTGVSVFVCVCIYVGGSRAVSFIEQLRQQASNAGGGGGGWGYSHTHTCKRVSAYTSGTYTLLSTCVCL